MYQNACTAQSAPFALLPLVCRGASDALAVQLLHDMPAALAADIQIEDHSHDWCGFLVNDEVMLVSRINQIAVRRKRPYKLPLFALIGQRATILRRNVLHIHLIICAREKPHGSVAFVIRVCVVRDTDEPDTPFKEFVVEVLLDDDRVAGKAALILAQNNINISLLSIALMTRESTCCMANQK